MPININGINSNSTNSLRSKTENTAAQPEKVDAHAPATNPAPEKADSVSLSSQVRDLKQLEGSIRNLPEVSQERVSKIKAALANGTYQVDNERLAGKLLDSQGDL